MSIKKATLVLLALSMVFVLCTASECTPEVIVQKEINVINAPVAEDTRPLCSNIPEALRDAARDSGTCKD